MDKEYLCKWLESKNRPASEFGKQVMDFLDSLYSGLHHISSATLMHPRTDWSSDCWIQITVPDGSFSTWDGNLLTHLVFLCHEHPMRCEVEAASNGYLRLCFSPRQREGRFSERHPSLLDAYSKWSGVKVSQMVGVE